MITKLKYFINFTIKLFDMEILIKITSVLYRIAPQIPNPIKQAKNNFKLVNQ